MGSVFSCENPGMEIFPQDLCELLEEGMCFGSGVLICVDFVVSG